MALETELGKVGEIKKIVCKQPQLKLKSSLDGKIVEKIEKYKEELQKANDILLHIRYENGVGDNLLMVLPTVNQFQEQGKNIYLVSEKPGSARRQFFKNEPNVKLVDQIPNSIDLIIQDSDYIKSYDCPIIRTHELAKYIEDPGYLHSIQFDLYLLQMLGVNPGEDFIPYLNISPEEEEKALEKYKDSFNFNKDKKAVFLNPTAAGVEDGSFKRWGAANFGKFGKLVLEKTDYPVIILSGNDPKPIDEINSYMDNKGVIVDDWSREEFTLRDLGIFLKHYCRLLVSCDTGPMHLGALMKVPTLGLFGASDSRHWGPIGQYAIEIEPSCGKKSFFSSKTPCSYAPQNCIEKDFCITAIPPEYVFSELEKESLLE